MNYKAPSYKSTSFNCPSCGAFSKQNWITLYFHGNNGFATIKSMEMVRCEHCSQTSFWFNEQMIIPDVGNVMMANSDLPADIIEDYNEARSILSKSPRGAAALLRLAIQKLCGFLGESGKNINTDIANLVKKGLPVRIQQSLDIVRVVGNNAVHPGQIDLKDNFELAVTLFGLINIIADVMITQPKHVESLYGSLPKNLIEEIDKRDKKT